MIDASKARDAGLEGKVTEEVLNVKSAPAVLFCVLGLGLLIVAGRSIVVSAVGIATGFGLAEPYWLRNTLCTLASCSKWAIGNTNKATSD